MSTCTRTVRSLSVVEIYDPASGRRTRGADLATARGWFSTSVLVDRNREQRNSSGSRTLSASALARAKVAHQPAQPARSV
jgi:hypothetical protein